MVEVTLQMSEEELLTLIVKEFNSIGRFANDDAELYIRWFKDLITNGSGTFLYGPVHLRTWLLETLDRTEVVDYRNDKYEEVKRLVEEGEFETNEYMIVNNFMNSYLIEYF